VITDLTCLEISIAMENAYLLFNYILVSTGAICGCENGEAIAPEPDQKN
jgi:hypothetical protein